MCIRWNWHVIYLKKIWIKKDSYTRTASYQLRGLPAVAVNCRRRRTLNLTSPQNKIFSGLVTLAIPYNFFAWCTNNILLLQQDFRKYRVLLCSLIIIRVVNGQRTKTIFVSNGLLHPPQIFTPIYHIRNEPAPPVNLCFRLSGFGIFLMINRTS